jgi:hypothetical protein
MEEKTTPDTSLGDYLASHGGPFYELQRRLGLLHESALNVGRRAALFVVLCFGVPLLLSLLEQPASGVQGMRSFIGDLGVWARFFVAVGLFILVERRVEIKLRATLREFAEAPILAPSSFEAAAAAVTSALRRRDSRVAEAICLILAYAATLITLTNALEGPETGWAVRETEGDRYLTLAGWWCILISNPIFWFLFLRGLWRFAVWALLLFDLAKLKFRLVATHPDGHGGLAFLSRYPNAYVMFVLGISSVVGAVLAHQLMAGTLATTTYGYVIAGWLLIVLALFAIPFIAFVSPLSDVKRRTLLEASAKATQFQRLAERKVFGQNVAAPDEGEAEKQTEVGDPSKTFDAARKMSVYLFNRSALVPVAAAAILPLAAAGLTMLPYKEILSIAKKLLLL